MAIAIRGTRNRRRPCHRLPAHLRYRFTIPLPNKLLALIGDKSTSCGAPPPATTREANEARGGSRFGPHTGAGSRAGGAGRDVPKWDDASQNGNLVPKWDIVL